VVLVKFFEWIRLSDFSFRNVYSYFAYPLSEAFRMNVNAKGRFVNYSMQQHMQVACWG